MRAGSVLPGPEPIPQSIEYLKQAEAIMADTIRKNPQVRFVRANLGLSSEYLAKAVQRPRELHHGSRVGT